TYPAGSGSRPLYVDIGDFNQDSILDIAIVNYGTNEISLHFGLGDATFLQGGLYSTGSGSQPNTLAVGDFNRDGRLDIVVANPGSDTIGDYSLPSAVAIADLNNDNMLDIAIANAGTNTILLLYGKGDGTFGDEELYPLGYNYRPYSVAVTDLNHDGFMDIIIACYGTDDVEILLKIC
ncbi:unnamed protein product, partial [Rotaria sordida]